MKFSDKLKKLRTERGLTQTELAKLIGTSKQVVCRYESGENTPKVTTADRMAKILHVPLAYLLNEAIDSYEEVMEAYSEETEEIQKLFSQLSPEQKRQVIQFATFLINQDK